MTHPTHHRASLILANEIFLEQKLLVVCVSFFLTESIRWLSLLKVCLFWPTTSIHPIETVVLEIPTLK